MGFSTYAKAGVSASGSSTGGARGQASMPGGWHPDVLYMLALVIAEIVVAGFLSRHLLG